MAAIEGVGTVCSPQLVAHDSNSAVIHILPLVKAPNLCTHTQVLPCIQPGPDDIVLPKTSSSVFVSTNIDYVLRALGMRGLVMAGCLTDQCVESAIRWVQRHKRGQCHTSCRHQEIRKHCNALLLSQSAMGVNCGRECSPIAATILTHCQSVASAHGLWNPKPLCAAGVVCRDACDLGYQVTQVTDGCVTYSQERHDASLRAIAGYCRQRTCDDVCCELEQRAAGSRVSSS